MISIDNGTPHRTQEKQNTQYAMLNAAETFNGLPGGALLAKPESLHHPQKVMTQEIIPNNALFQAAVENSYDVIELLREDGTILYISPSVSRSLGFKPPELVGTNAFGLVHPEDLPRLQEELTFALGQGYGEVSPYRCRAANGEWRWTKSTGSLLDPDANPRTIVVHSRDITEQEENRKALVKMNEDMLTIWESMTDGFFALDLEWKFTYINSEGERIVRRKREELLGKSLWQEFPETVDSIFYQQYHRAVAEQVTVQFETYYPPLDVWIEVRAYPSSAGLAVYFHDITERMQAEQAIRISEERLSRAHSIAQLGYLELNSATGEHFWSNEIYRIFGLEPQSIAGSFEQLLEFVHPEDRETAAAAGENLFEHNHPFDIEHRIVRTDGQVRWVQVQADVIYDAGANASRFVCTMLDITERRRAEEAQMRLASIVDSSNDAIISKTLEGIITTWNCGAEQIYGYTAEEAIGRHISMLLPPDRSLEESGILEKLKRGESAQHFETRHVRKDGQLIDVSLLSSPLLNSSGEIIGTSSIARDITLQKQAECERERFFVLSLDILCIFDEQGVIKRISPAVATVLGYAPGELTGRSLLEALHPDDEAATKQTLEQLASGQAVTDFVNRYRCRDGSYKSILWTTTPHDGLFYGAGRDITAMKAAEVEREQSHSLLRATLESTADGILVLNGQGRITHYNQQFLSMWHIPEGLIQSGETARVIEFVKDQLTDPEGFKVAANTSSAELGRKGFDLQHFKDGRIFERYTSIQSLSEQEVGRVISYRDITEVMATQSALQQANAKLEQRVAERTTELGDINRELRAQIAERQIAVNAMRELVELYDQAKKDAESARESADIARAQAEAAREEAEAANRAKSEFLSRMSHELRTPLNAILGFAQVLEMRGPQPRDKAPLQQILNGGQHLLQLINEVLEISRIEAGHLPISIEPVQLRQALAEALNLVRPLATQRDITLVLDEDAGSQFLLDAYVAADQQRLRQVLLNLFSNAVKYNRSGGTVSVSVRQGTGDTAPGTTNGSITTNGSVSPNGVEQSSPTAASYLRIGVRDTGPGIAAEDQKKLFLPFERLGAEKTNVEGTGIGLALVKRLTELMHGRIGVESRPGKGSLFWVDLPHAVNPSPQALQPESSATKPAWQREILPLERPVTLLYIEDNISNLSLIQNFLDNVPQIRLLTALQGRIGLDLASQHHPDLILLDLHLPDIMGDEVLRELQGDAATRDIPVVMLSADATEKQVERLLASGARHYLTKPLNLKEFVQTLKRFLT